MSKKDKLLASAQRLVLKGQVDRAIKEYQLIVAGEPKEVRYRQKLAELLLRDNRREEAIQEYRVIGKHYTDNSYFLRAIAIYKQIQRLSPDDVEVALTLASLNHKQGLTVNAMAQYGQVVVQLEEQGALKEAAHVLEKMIEIDGGHAASRLKYAEILLLVGAREASCQAFANLLLMLRAGGDLSGALKVSGRLAQLFPDYQQAAEAPIQAETSPAKGDGDVASWHETLGGEGQDQKGWQLKCQAERGKENKVGLRRILEQMMDLFPNDLDVVEEAIRCDLEGGDVESALALLERHCRAFREKGRALPVEDLFSLLPERVAMDAHMQQEFERICQITGVTKKRARAKPPLAVGQNEIPLDLDLSSGWLSAPPPLEPAEASLEPAVELGPIDVWSTPKDEPLPALPWDQELELDLGDDSSYSFAATVQNSVLFPDFSLLMDFPEDGLSAPLKETDLPGELSVKEGGDNPPSPFPAEVERESRPSAGWQEIYPDSPTPYPMDVWELESRYDLGLGYKEMGLYAQAIEEFAYAAGNPQRRLDCLTLQAICYREKGEPAKAQALLQRGRSLDVLTIQERMFLDYELAFLLEMTGLLDEAILMYSEVQAVDPSYRDVDSRLSKLLGREPLDIIDLELVVGDS